MNDVDFPVERVLEGIDAAAAAGLAPVKVNMVVKRGVNEDSVVPMARHFRDTRPHRCASSSTWTSATRTAGGWTTSCRRPRSSRAIDARFAARAGRAGYPGEVAERWRYRDGERRDRRHRLGHAAVLRRLHARAPLGRRPAFTCLFASAGHDLRALLRGGASDERASPPRSAAIWRARADRYSELRTAATRGLPKVEMSYIGG